MKDQGQLSTSAGNMLVRVICRGLLQASSNSQLSLEQPQIIVGMSAPTSGTGYRGNTRLKSGPRSLGDESGPTLLPSQSSQSSILRDCACGVFFIQLVQQSLAIGDRCPRGLRPPRSYSSFDSTNCAVTCAFVAAARSVYVVVRFTPKSGH